MNVTNLFISSPSQVGSGVALKILADQTSIADGDISVNVDTSSYSRLRLLILTMPSPGLPYLPLLRFNGDNASNYGWAKFSAGYSSDADDTEIEYIASAVTYGTFASFDVNNDTAQVKSVFGFANFTTKLGAGYAVTANWANTANRISSVDLTASTNPLKAGARIQVLGV